MSSKKSLAAPGEKARVTPKNVTMNGKGNKPSPSRMFNGISNKNSKGK